MYHDVYVLCVWRNSVKVSDFKNAIWDYTRKIAESTNNAFNPICEQYGLTMMQVRILVQLYQYGPYTVGTLADSINAAGTNISSMCKKLEGKALLERVRDQQDERVVKVALTELGKDIVLEIDKTLNEKISQQLMGESEETFDDIILGLQKLNNLLERVGKVIKEQ
jgi:DNA-binding MarR family transcriptional regulator